MILRGLLYLITQFKKLLKKFLNPKIINYLKLYSEKKNLDIFFINKMTIITIPTSYHEFLLSQKPFE